MIDNTTTVKPMYLGLLEVYTNNATGATRTKIKPFSIGGAIISAFILIILIKLARR